MSGQTANNGWQTGTPQVTEGKEEPFWCAVKTKWNGQDRVGYRYLQYGNKYVMPLSDSCHDAPSIAVPIGDDGEYEWTGWWEESCEHCDTYWIFTDEVIAWMPMPRNYSADLTPAAEPNAALKRDAEHEQMIEGAMAMLTASDNVEKMSDKELVALVEREIWAKLCNFGSPQDWLLNELINRFETQRGIKRDDNGSILP